jgi:hypothetical protein
VAPTVAVSDRLRVAPWESIPAPWGEPQIQVPYVVITTQPWPEEWWRPNARRLPRDGDPADLPESRLVATHPNGTGSDGTARDGGSADGLPIDHQGPSRIGVIPVVRGGVAPAGHDDGLHDATLLREDRARRREVRMKSVARAQAQRRLEGEQLAEARARRRGTLTRLAIFVVGLVISVIAVETASRRRS